MHTYSIWVPIILAVIAYVGIIQTLGPGLWLQEPLIMGLVTGWIVGDVHLGLVIGATLTLMSLGLWTYGGATIPDYTTGAILGTAIGALGGGEAAGLAVAIPASLLMTQLDVLGRAVTTIFIHAADRYAENGNEAGVSWMHMLGQLPWGLTRAIPVFLAVLFGAGPIHSVINNMPQWFMNGMHVTGEILPALGFALLLNMLPIKKYWAFLIVGFVLFAYLNVPILGIALAALAASFLFIQLKGSAADV